MNQFYNQEINEIFPCFNTIETTGLTPEDAKRRLGEHGYYQLDSKRKKSFFEVFIAQYKSFMIITLLIAAAISGVVGVMEGEGLPDTFVIPGILILILVIDIFKLFRINGTNHE